MTSRPPPPRRISGATHAAQKLDLGFTTLISCDFWRSGWAWGRTFSTQNQMPERSVGCSFRPFDLAGTPFPLVKLPKLYGTNLIRSECDPGLPTHDLKQNPDPLVWCKALDLRDDLREGTSRDPNPVAGLQQLGGQ